MKFEDETKESNSYLEQAECDIRDYGKKVHGFEIEFDETLDKLNKANETYEEKDKSHKEVEADIAALTRRIMLMEEESKKAEVNLANTVTKLALSSKQADEVLKKVKGVESKCKLRCQHCFRWTWSQLHQGIVLLHPCCDVPVP